MNIVHIGAGTTLAEIEHIAGYRDAGHDYYVPGDSTHEQLVRRIPGADEIHVWDISREFELGMVYFFLVHALHYKLNQRVRLFGDALAGGRDSLTPLFAEQHKECETCDGDGHVARQWVDDKYEAVKCGKCGGSGKQFEPPCHSGIGPCGDCGDRAECERLRREHNG